MTYETRFVPRPFCDELCLILHTCTRLYCCDTSDIMINTNEFVTRSVVRVSLSYMYNYNYILCL